jgi:demethylmenaquinone methyltransferase/2-methoxy-6-polyprenyl-1,4-benzoquinol methylase
MNKGIQKIFSEVSQTYELANRILTLGMDTLWRKQAAKLAVADGGTKWMDICSGTGETAVHLGRMAKEKTMVVAADFCMPMLRKATQKPEANKISFTNADASALPFRDETFDLVAISFATRNINVTRDDMIQCFREFYRVLRPGGRFVNLETSQPSSELVRKIFHLYVRLIVKPLGYMVSGSRRGYKYLSHTIPRFYRSDQLADIIRQSGFVRVDIRPMMFGIIAIHKATK